MNPTPRSSAFLQLRSWISSTTWRERVIAFEPSWFTLTMGTGVIVQLLNYFPWPSYWLSNLGYVFWILNIVLVSFFTTMGCLRLLMYPRIVFSILDDVQQTSYLGAIPVSFDTIITGIALYYKTRTYAMYVAEAFYWINVVMTVAVTLGGVFAMYKRQGQHKLEQVTGVWLLTFIPMIVTAALGSTLVPSLLGDNSTTILIVSFIMLSLGLGLSFVIITIYFWRLMACNLPPRDAIVSCFVPVGPLAMGAFTVLSLSLDLSQFIMLHPFMIEESWIPPYNTVSQAAIAQMVVWIGVIFAFMLLGVATFFLIEAFASFFAKIPKTFNIGFWSFVFPCGVYANAFCRLSTTLRNDGIKGWAAACVVGTLLLWMMCATMTTYKGVWQGKTFVAPGLQGYIPQEEANAYEEKSDTSYSDTALHSNSTGYRISPDGTYQRSTLTNGQKLGNEGGNSV